MGALLNGLSRIFLEPAPVAAAGELAAEEPAWGAPAASPSAAAAGPAAWTAPVASPSAVAVDPAARAARAGTAEPSWFASAASPSPPPAAIPLAPASGVAAAVVPVDVPLWVAPSLPQRRAPTAAATEPPAPRSIAVVCSARDAVVAGGAAGLAAAIAARAKWALVVEWGTGGAADDVRDRAPTRPARRAVEALRIQGHAARAVGRLVRLALPEGADLAADLERLATVPVPIVLVVAGGREAGVDEVLARQDAIVLAAPAAADEDIVALAVAELEALVPVVHAVRLAGAPVAAALARSGTALSGPLRAPLLVAVSAPAAQAAT